MVRNKKVYVTDRLSRQHLQGAAVNVSECEGVQTEPRCPLYSPLPVLQYPIMHCRSWEKSTTNNRGRNKRSWRLTSPSRHMTGSPQNYKSLGILCSSMAILLLEKLQFNFLNWHLILSLYFPPGCQGQMMVCLQHGETMGWVKLPLLLCLRPGWAEWVKRRTTAEAKYRRTSPNSSHSIRYRENYRLIPPGLWQVREKKIQTWIGLVLQLFLIYLSILRCFRLTLNGINRLNSCFVL